MRTSIKKYKNIAIVTLLMTTMLLITIAGCQNENIVEDSLGDIDSTPTASTPDNWQSTPPAENQDEGNGSWDDLPSLEIPEGTNIITLATFHSLDIRDAVAEFNAADNNCYIEVVDYAQYNTENDYTAGLMKLSTEIISGKVPDILDVSYLPYETYALKGLFTDLYPYIDADPEISRNDFVEGVFNAAEINGRLYQVFPSFYITSVIGHPSVVGAEMGWNINEFRNVIAMHPEDEIPLHRSWMNKTWLLRSELVFNTDKYINWETGTTKFDTAEFIQLLEYFNTFPDEIDLSSGRAAYSAGLGKPEDDIPAGRQILEEIHFGDFWMFRWNRALFGNDVVFKGFPADNRNGHSITVNGGLAICENSQNKAVAWSFIRTLLDEDFQLSNHWSREGFLTNSAAFDYRAQEAINYTPSPGLVNIPVADFTQGDVDQIVSLIQNAGAITTSVDSWGIDNDIWNIVREEASNYFNDKCSAADAARIIQSRVSILVSERS